MNMHPKYARLVRRSPEHHQHKTFVFAIPKMSRKIFFFVAMFACIVLLVSVGIFFFSPRGVVKGAYADGYHYQYQDKKSSFDSIAFAKSDKLLPSYRIKEGDVSLAMTYSPTRVKDSYTVISSAWGSRDSLKFKDVEENTNIIYTLEGKNTVKEDIELTKRPTKESLSFYKFTIELTGLTYERDKNGTIIPVFFDKKGTEYSIPPLVMKDASGKESNLVTLTLSAPDPKFPHVLTAIVMPDAQWLTDQARKYPVRIDPTVVRGDAPVAYWKFDEGYGTTANNSTAQTSWTGTISGPTWQTEDQCISGKCVYQDGTSDKYSSISSNITSGWTANNDFTVNLWFNCKGEGYSAPPYSYLAGLFIHGNSADSGTGGFYLRQSSISCANMIFQVSATTVSNSIVPNLTSGANKWAMITATKEGDTLKLYENGLLVGSQTFAGANWNVNVAQPTLIGSVHGRSVKGSIDDVKVYSYARTTTQINADYNAKGSASAIGSSAVLGKSTANNDAFSNGLVGYWKMDEASGSIVDSSGNNNTGTITGTTVTSGKYGNSRNFSSTSDVAAITSIAIPGSWSISSWFKYPFPSASCNTLTRGVNYDHQVIIQCGGTLLGTYDNHSLGWVSSGFNTNTLSNGWHHLVAVGDGGVTKFYVDGSYVGTANYQSNSEISYIGNYQGGSQQFGTVDELRIYNRALSPAEVRALYEYAPGPVAHFSFEEGSGQSANDQIGNNNNFTLGASSTVGSDDPTWTNGKYGKALSFDGSADYVGASVLTTNKPFTVSAWVNARDVSASHHGIFATSNRHLLSIHNSGVLFGVCTGCAWASGPTSINANTWYYITGVYDGTYATVYVNGVKGTPDAQSISTGDSWTRIGDEYGGGKFNGLIDDVRIYNYARTAKQITEDMQGSQPVVSAGSSGGGVGQGAVGYWKFDEGYGTTANNSGSGGSTINGTNTGATWSNNGKYGKALGFNNNYVQIPNNSAFTITQDGFTYSAWINPTTLNTAYNMFMGHWLPYFCVYTNRLYMSMYAGGSQQGVWGNTQTITTNQWYHVAATYDSQGYMKVYLNGKLDGSAGPYLTPNNYSVDMLFGTWESGHSYPFYGLIDEVKVYNSALTEDEIKAEYNQGSALVLGSKVEDASDNPVGYWKLDEASGNTAANTGSGTGNATWSSTGTWVNGRINGAGNVNGQYLVHSTTGLSSTNGTVEAWVKPITGTDDYWGVWQTHDSSSVNWVDWIWLGRYGSTMYFRMGNGSDCCSNDTTFTSTDYFPSDQWTHVAATWKGDADSVADDTMTVYVNGVQMVQRTNVSLQATLDASARIGFGHTYAADGHMDEVKVYNYARSAEQIKADAATDTLNPSLPGAPVGEWKFEEGTGTSANDTSGNGNTGTLNSSPSWAPGKIGKGLLFSGSNNVTLGAAKHDTLTNATFETWFNYTGGFDDNYVIVQRYKDSSNRQPIFVSYSGGYGNKVVFENIVGGSNRGITSDSTIVANTWYHLAVTCGSGGMKMYLNGQVQASTNATTDCFSSIAATTETYIGQNFKGTLDQTKIYNYARTPAQIAYDYNRGKPVAYYRLNECTGSTIHSTNETYNSNLNGTITIGGSGSQTSVGTCTTSSTAWGNGEAGKVNSSLNFDGTDDMVLNNSGGFLPTGDNPRTIAFWFKPQAGMTTSNGAVGYGCSTEGYGCSSPGVGRYVGAWANTSNIGIHLETCQVTGPSTPSPTTGWHLYTAVFNGNNTISFYIDGNGPTTVTPGCTINTAAGNGWSMGVARWGYYNGQIDEVQVYNYGLSPEQIKAVYSNGAVSFK